MITPRWTLRLAALGLVLAGADPGARAQGLAGVQVLGRGPIHEAFAVPVVNRFVPPPVVPIQPPDAIDEQPPDQGPAGDNVQWIPGYWSYDDAATRFVWVSGTWRFVPPGRRWVPGGWVEVRGGWQWTPGFWADAALQQVSFLPPPPVSIDPGPATRAPGAGSIYVPGSWVYRLGRYYWRPGFWYTPRAGWVWVPPRYAWTPAGWVFIDGYWDYPLADRGLLFAPVVIDRRYWNRPDWVYQPAYALSEPALLTALFVRPDWGAYYFGNYFEPRFRRLRFYSWVNYHPVGAVYDPLFTYYRWQHRGEKTWERELRAVYIRRFNGDAPRPALTLVQQDTLVRKIERRPSANPSAVQSVALLTPLGAVNMGAVRVRPLPRERLARERKVVRELRAAGRERQRVVDRALAQGPAPKRPTDRPRVVSLTLPGAAAARPSATANPPAPPAQPKAVVKPIPRREPPRPSVLPRPRTTDTDVTRPYRTNPRVEDRTITRPDTRPDTRPGTRPDTRPDTRPATRPDTRPTTRPGTTDRLRDTDRKPATRPEPKPATRPPMPPKDSKPPAGTKPPSGTQTGKPPA